MSVEIQAWRLYFQKWESIRNENNSLDLKASSKSIYSKEEIYFFLKTHFSSQNHKSYDIFNLVIENKEYNDEEYLLIYIPLYNIFNPNVHNIKAIFGEIANSNQNGSSNKSIIKLNDLK